MAVAAHLGEFLRTHSDLDIGVFVDDICPFEQHLAEQGYRLFSRNPFTKLLEYSPIDIVRTVTAREIASVRRVKRLTAIKVNDRGRLDWHESLLPRFDVHIHRGGLENVYLTDDRYAFPADLFHANATYRTLTDRKISLASVPFLYFFKLQGRRPKHRFDQRLLEEHRLISKRDALRVRRVLQRARPQAYRETPYCGTSFDRPERYRSGEIHIDTAPTMAAARAIVQDVTVSDTGPASVGTLAPASLQSSPTSA
jgi:hypothetical protein